MSKNNLVEIAKILIDMRQERELNGVPKSVMSRYPEGSQGIVIDEDKFIVLNSQETDEVKETDKINTLKDSQLKYNENFFFSTYESDEPDIIDETHNKSKLIHEAYTEVSFLQKDIFSEAEFNNDEKEKAKNCIGSIIDKGCLCANDFESFKVDEAKSTYYTGNVYDEIYRCRCVFTDISGNESMKSLLIKAYKVSTKKDADYKYFVIDNDNIRELVEELENIVKDDKSKTMRSEYSSITNSDDYENIKKHIREAIEVYYQENRDRFYRLTRVDIKAIYCLRLRKTPIAVYFRVDGDHDIAKYNTFYSPIAKEFNRFTCPNCGTLSDENGFGIKFHVDHDLSSSEDTIEYDALNPIGCSDCMEKCERCGSWHFKLDKLDQVLDNNYLIGKRKFLKNYINKDFKSEDLCSCKEYLNWIYDEMSKVVEVFGDKNVYHSEIIDNFLYESCKLVFINYLTGEVVADNNDFLEFLYYFLKSYLLKYSRRGSSKKEISAKYDEVYQNFIKDSVDKSPKQYIRNFIDEYIINDDDKFTGVDIQKAVQEALIEFKEKLAEAFNIPFEDIKATSKDKTEKCFCCDSYYYAGTNFEGEIYYNDVKGLCACCAEANIKHYRMWTRADDGVTYYKPKLNKNHGPKIKKNKKGKKGIEIEDGVLLEDQSEESIELEHMLTEKATRIYNSKTGEEIFESWLNKTISKIIKDVEKK